MPHASAVRLTHALPFALALALAMPEPVHAEMFVPEPLAPVHTRATAAIAAPPATPRLVGAPTAGIDGEGRNVSLSVPTHVSLYGLARADEMSVRTVVEATGASAGRLSLALTSPVADTKSAGAYVGVVRVSLDYN